MKSQILFFLLMIIPFIGISQDQEDPPEQPEEFFSNYQMTRDVVQDDVILLKPLGGTAGNPRRSFRLKLIFHEWRIEIFHEGDKVAESPIVSRKDSQIAEANHHSHLVLPSGGQFIVKREYGRIIEVMEVTAYGGNIIYLNKEL